MNYFRLLPLLFLLSILFFFGGLTACDKEPEVITKTDTLVIVDTLTIIDIQDLPDTMTTFILVRHAETTGIGTNPGLSSTGLARVNELTRILEDVNLAAVYSTNFNRTMGTAQPVANAKGITVSQYDAFNPTLLIDQVLSSFPQGTILVVGHSNTTASMLNAMIGSNQYADLNESEYDNLFIVSLSERGHATVTHLKYGTE